MNVFKVIVLMICFILLIGPTGSVIIKETVEERVCAFILGFLYMLIIYYIWVT